uniref:Movement protein n=1 Tax=Haemonchus placei TaxID=6290 RepID=A0A0N4WXJ1_HAEPC
LVSTKTISSPSRMSVGGAQQLLYSSKIESHLSYSSNNQ